MPLPVYLLFGLVLLAAGFAVFRVLLRRDYLRRGRATPVTVLLEWVVMLSWVCFTWCDWPGRFPPRGVDVVPTVIGWILIVIGIPGMAMAMAELGLRRMHGVQVDVLKRTGPYRFSRNPQTVFCTLAILGYSLLWPSWHTLGWVVVFLALVHMMVLTEEEHLRRAHGKEYERYCEQVPRYLGRRGS